MNDAPVGARDHDSLSRRIERLQVAHELRTLKARYCRYAEAKAWGDLDRLFTENAQARAYDAGGALTYFARSPDIGGTLGAVVGRGELVVHVFQEQLTAHSPSRAEAVWAMEDYLVRPGPDGLAVVRHGFGHYHETYERDGGRWLIRSLELTRSLEPLSTTVTPTTPTTRNPPEGPPS